MHTLRDTHLTQTVAPNKIDYHGNKVTSRNID